METQWFVEQIKQCNMYAVGVQKEREEQEAGKMFEEIMANICPFFLRSLNPESQEAQWTTSRINPQRTIPWHIIIKIYIQMIKRKILKRKSHIKYREVKIRIATNFSSEAILIRRQWNSIIKVLKEKMYS